MCISPRLHKRKKINLARTERLLQQAHLTQVKPNMHSSDSDSCSKLSHQTPLPGSPSQPGRRWNCFQKGSGWALRGFPPIRMQWTTKLQNKRGNSQNTTLISFLSSHLHCTRSRPTGSQTPACTNLYSTWWTLQVSGQHKCLLFSWETVDNQAPQSTPCATLLKFKKHN